MSKLAELDERVTRLEIEMGDVRKLASAASAESADVHARLRAHTKSLEALRATQLEQGKAIGDLRTEMREGFARVDERFARVDQRFIGLETEMRGRFTQLETEMRDGFSTMGVGMAQINALLKIAIGQRDES